MENIELKKTTLSFGDYLLLFILIFILSIFSFFAGYSFAKGYFK